MKVGDKVMGTPLLYRDFNESEDQLPRGTVGKVTDMDCSVYPIKVEWAGRAGDRWNIYNSYHLRVVGITEYYKQLTK